MAQRPPRDLDWISDDSTGITVPSTIKQNAGWVVEKPARQFFNWMWNRLSRWTHYFSGQSQEWIVIDSTNANEKDYDTLAAYIADSPAAGDKVLVKETQVLTAQMVIPDGITLRILNGVDFTRSTSEANSVIKFGSDIIIEGVLNLILSQTGTTAKAVEFDGDNVIGKINVENSSTGTLTTVCHINEDKIGNRIEGFIQNTGGGTITHEIINNSLNITNYLLLINNQKIISSVFDFIFYDMQFANYLGLLSDVSSENTSPGGLAFSDDGLIMFTLDGFSNTVYQYTLSTPWDVSTASYASKSFSVATQETSSEGLAFSSDGATMFVVGTANTTVYQYTLSTPWDVSTASYAAKSFDVSIQEATPNGLAFSSDGATMFVVGTANTTVYQYTLSTPWDVSTASYAAKSFDVSTQETVPQELAFNDDGLKMFVVGTINDTVYQYTLSTPWDVSTASYANKSFSVTAEEASPQGLAFSSNGAKMFVIGIGNDTVYQYASSFVILK